ncbi:MAG: M20 family metallopeptidase [Actinobacteria bacterium]|nr:M20 family metallopeptidase [Actinomycetota bacterium]MCL5070766.1 M20 family metallopeptidase [Actinomycetota bacterium]
MEIIKEIKEEIQELINIRRELHKIPEIGFREVRTSEFIEKKLKEFGLSIKTKIAKTGVVGLINTSTTSGKTIMLRADMDGLPILENTGVDYASKHEGFMHACGHDGHMAIALITAKILSRNRNLLNGNVKFVFQPAEESPGGAKPMIEAGILKNPNVDVVIGLHIWNKIDSGQIGIRTGPIMASVNSFKINIIGKSAHGAMPQDGVDAITVCSRVIESLQTIVSREINPISPCVITIGKIHGGTAFNILAQEVELEGTIRTLDPNLNEIIASKMKRMIKGVTESMNAKYKFDFKHMYPVTINDKNITNTVSLCAAETVGVKNVIEAEQTMGGDDIAFYLQKVPGCYFFLGSSKKEKNQDYPLHSSSFNFDENCLKIGVEVILRAIFKVL